MKPFVGVTTVTATKSAFTVLDMVLTSSSLVVSVQFQCGGLQRTFLLPQQRGSKLQPYCFVKVEIQSAQFGFRYFWISSVQGVSFRAASV